MQKDKKSEIEKVNMCCFFLIKTMLEANAQEMKIKQEAFHDSEKELGDFEVVVRKIKNSK